MVRTEDQSYVVGDDRLKGNLGEFHDLRMPHLKDLRRVEEVLRQKLPLPTTYDVNRTQPPYFAEFTHTECLGGLYVTPQSAEVAARLAQRGADEKHPLDHDPVESIMARLDETGTLDKYRLTAISAPHARKVAFTPGSNLFVSMVSRELLTRAMHENPDMVIKPHPMTNEGNMKMLCREFGYHRVIEPMESGWAYLRAADEVWTASTTEMALYAVLLGKPVHNISNFFTEATGVYHPFFRLPDRESLVRSLSSPFSGFLCPSDPNLSERIDVYVRAAMDAREQFRPLAHELSPVQWSDARLANFKG